MTERPHQDPATTQVTVPEDGVARPDETHLADAVVAMVTAQPDVVRMHAGMFGEVATYLPGRRVVGVQIRPDATNIHVVLAWGADLGRSADLIGAAVEPLVGTPVNVTVQDLADPPGV